MYTSVQYVGVKLTTEKTYGLPKEDEDIAYRCGIVKDLIDKAYNSGHITSDSKCLKIMLFPEFMFRGSIGAYTMEGTLKIVEKLREMVNTPNFKDWLFVFGTIVGYSKNENKEDKPYETYNFSFIQKGNKGEAQSHIVLKKNKSAIDFERNPRKPIITVWNTKYLKPAKLERINGEQQQLNYDGNAIINVDGLKIGVEICMDNLRNRISPLVKANKDLDVHIIVSCGISMTDMKYYGKLHKNGVFMLCDGQECVVRIGVNRKRDLPNQTDLEFYPEDEETFRDIFWQDNATVVVFEPVSIEKEKKLEKYYGCRIF